MEYTKNNSTKLIIFVIACVLTMLAIVGYTYSYFFIEKVDDSTISGRVASLSLSLNVNKLFPTNTKGLIPQLDEFITKAVIGADTVDVNGKHLGEEGYIDTRTPCIDHNSNNICQVYQIKVRNTSSVSLHANGTVALNANNNPNLKWARISGTTNPTLVSSVNIPSTVTLVQNEEFTANEEKIYYIVVWISETGDVQNDTGAFTGVVTFGDASNTGSETGESVANVPELVDGLIPVYYNENTSSWVTTDDTNEDTKWYSYNDKKWANAILVDSSVRTAYQTPETPVDMSKVLAFYVWIPRYKYRVWNINKIDFYDPEAVWLFPYDAYNEGIDIIFENGTETTGTITCNDYDFTVTGGDDLSETCSDVVDGNGYYTHPAFTFGEDDVTGFWMGKFEVSDVLNETKIIPNAISNQNVVNISQIKPESYFWSAIYDMQSSGNSYGLSTDRTVTDSHMITNMEWGAVAYLTHSDYGRCSNDICEEVAINNSSSHYTGRSAGAPGSSSTTISEAGTYTYETSNGQLASTTGNIYGVYDMSGGAWEIVMGNMGSSDTVGVSYTYNEGFGTYYIYEGYEKYITTYSYIDFSAYKQYTRGRLGDATSEVIINPGAWYVDGALFLTDTQAWYRRGGDYLGQEYSGIFRFDAISGSPYGNNSDSSRAVLIGF